MNNVIYTSEMKLSLMNSSLVFTNNGNVTTIIELNEFSNLHSWENEKFDYSSHECKTLGREYGTTITLNTDIANNFHDTSVYKQQILIRCESEELRDQLNNKIYSFLYFNNFIKSKTIYLRINKNESPLRVSLFSIFDIIVNTSPTNTIKIIYPDYSKDIELPSGEDVLNLGDVLKQISDLYIKTRDTMSEEDMISLSRKVETLKQFSFIIY